MEKMNHSTSIQGLKGVCAIVVFLSHSLLMYKSDIIANLQSSPLHLFFDGQCAVIIFFCISGFFYYTQEPLTIKKYIAKVKKKVIRIYPAYILSMVIGLLLCNLMIKYDHSLFTDWSNQFWQTKVGIKEFIWQLPVILPGSNPNLINPPTWYLNTEVKMFLIMPLVVGLFNKSRQFGGGGVYRYYSYYIYPCISEVCQYDLLHSRIHGPLCE